MPDWDPKSCLGNKTLTHTEIQIEDPSLDLDSTKKASVWAEIEAQLLIYKYNTLVKCLKFYMDLHIHIDHEYWGLWVRNSLLASGPKLYMGSIL